MVSLFFILFEGVKLMCFFVSLLCIEKFILEMEFKIFFLVFLYYIFVRFNVVFNFFEDMYFG